MAYINRKATEKRPNFIASEVGLVLKTVQVNDTGITADEYGYKTVKGGTIYPSDDASAKGIIFENVDVTHGERAASLIVGGRIYTDRLHTAPSSAAKTALAAKGIVFDDDEPAIYRVATKAKAYTAGTTAFSASDIAENADGLALEITAIGSDNDTEIATAALSAKKVTMTKVKAGKTQITCTVTDSLGGKTVITVPVEIA